MGDLDHSSRACVWVYVWSILRLTVRVVWSAGARILTASYRSVVRLINLALWLLLHLSLSLGPLSFLGIPLRDFSRRILINSPTKTTALSRIPMSNLGKDVNPARIMCQSTTLRERSLRNKR